MPNLMPNSKNNAKKLQNYQTEIFTAKKYQT